MHIFNVYNLTSLVIFICPWESYALEEGIWEKREKQRSRGHVWKGKCKHPSFDFWLRKSISPLWRNYPVSWLPILLNRKKIHIFHIDLSLVKEHNWVAIVANDVSSTYYVLDSVPGLPLSRRFKFTWKAAVTLAMSSVPLAWLGSSAKPVGTNSAEIWSCASRQKLCGGKGLGGAALHYSPSPLSFTWAAVRRNSMLWCGEQNQRPKFPKSWLPNTLCPGR